MLSMAATLSRRALAGTCASFVVRHATSLSRGREAAAGSAADVLDLTSPIDDAHYVLTRVYPRPWGAEPAIDLAHILPGRAGALLRRCGCPRPVRSARWRASPGSGGVGPAGVQLRRDVVCGELRQQVLRADRGRPLLRYGS